MSKIIGIDLGTNSIGWSIIDDVKQTIIDSGVRIFPSGVDERGKPNNQKRREKRQSRRQLFRRKLRRRTLIKELINHNMFPNIEVSRIKEELSKTVLRDDLRAFFFLDPYVLRNKAAEGEKLSLIELGRVFFHFIKRRGYKGNRLSGATDDESVIMSGTEFKQGITPTLEGINKGGYKTLGQYLNSLDTHKERIRNRYTLRSMYMDEFHLVWKEQQKFYPELLTDKLLVRLRDEIIFFQNPLKSQKHLVGKCSFEPSKSKALVSALNFEEFRMYQFLNTIEVQGKLLSVVQWEQIIPIFYKKDSFKFSDIKKKLGLKNQSFNYADDHKVSGNTSHIALYKLFTEKKFNSFSEKEKHDIWHVIATADNDEWLSEYASVNWEFNEKQLLQLKKTRFKQGYAALSSKAINLIVPYLKLGVPYHRAVIFGGVQNAFGCEVWEQLTEVDRHAVIDTCDSILDEKKDVPQVERLKEFLRKTYQLSEKRLMKLYHHSDIEHRKHTGEELLLPIPPKTRNPIVDKALGELRKVVNQLIEKYGKPDKISVELAREVKLSKKEKDRISKDQYQNELKNNEAKWFLSQNNLPLSRQNVRKYLLHKECNGTCVYTGQKIGVEDLYTEGYIQVEHIIPRSISFNNSLSNLTLCIADENRAKANKSPYEFYGVHEEAWSEIKQRAYSAFSYPKYKRFISKTMPDEDEFLSSQLNDTRYMSKVAKNYLTHVCPDIQVTQGKVTAMLRQRWGLNSIVQEPINVGDMAEGQYIVALNKEDKISQISPFPIDETGKDAMAERKNLIKKWEKKGKVIEGVVQNNRFYPAKDRSDHAHHLIDAVVVAVTKRSFLQEISTRWAKEQTEQFLEKKKFDMPWSNFRQDIKQQVAALLVSYVQKDRTYEKAKHKDPKTGYIHESDVARGQIHNETVYGRKDKESFELRRRKPIDALTHSELNGVDEGIQNMIKQKLGIAIDEKFTAENFKKIPKDFFFKKIDGKMQPQLFLPNKNGAPVPIKKVRIKLSSSTAVALDNEGKQWVKPENNYMVLILQDLTTGKYEDRLITFWHAVENKKQGLAPYGNIEEGKKLILTLKENDMFLFNVAPEEINWENPIKEQLSENLYRVQNISRGDYSFRHHRESTVNNPYKQVRVRSAANFIKLQPCKLNISYIGEISPVL